MPRYRVVEKRCREARYIIDAADENAARHYDGDIIDEGGDADDYGEETISVEQVGDEEDMA